MKRLAGNLKLSGLNIDYNIVNGTLSNYTFQGDRSVGGVLEYGSAFKSSVSADRIIFPLT